MAKFKDERRPSTIIRHKQVLQVYGEVLKELGEYSVLVPKSYIYERVRERTGLCAKTIAFVINHLTNMGGVRCEFLVLRKLFRAFRKATFCRGLCRG